MKLYQELRLESLQNRCKLRRLSLFYKIYNDQSPLYIFFPATITEWNDLDQSLRNAPSINVSKQNILKFIRLGPNKVFKIYNPHGLKLLTRLHLGLSHLQGHKFNRNFIDCLDEICMCGKDIESTNNLLLQCSLFLKERQVLMNKNRDIDSSLIDQNENSLCYTLLFGKENMNDSYNAHILNAIIEYTLSIERFNVPLFE